MIEITSEYLAAQGLSANFPKRFWLKVERTAGCWIWTGRKHDFGYGEIWRGAGTSSLGPVRAHVASWILHRGPIPEGMFVLHNCPGGDNPSCVRPDHLWLGSQSENMTDKMNKGRYVYPKVHHGEGHYAHKLTDAAIRQIRSITPYYGFLRQMADRFGVSVSAIWHVVHGRKWKHLH